MASGMAGKGAIVVVEGQAARVGQGLRIQEAGIGHAQEIVEVQEPGLHAPEIGAREKAVGARGRRTDSVETPARRANNAPAASR